MLVSCFGYNSKTKILYPQVFGDDGIGDVTKIRIGFANPRIQQSWFLEKVCILFINIKYQRPICCFNYFLVFVDTMSRSAYI